MVAVAMSLPACSGGGGQLATVDFVALDGHSAFTASSEDVTSASLGLSDKDEFSSCVNGIFASEVYNGISKVTNLYRYRDGKAELLDSGFVAVGVYNCGLIPTTKPGSPIVVLDGDAKPVFTAGPVNGVQVKRVAAMYAEDLLWFELENKTYGFFDKKGNVAFLFPEGVNFGYGYAGKVDTYFKSGFVFVHGKDGYATYDKDGDLLHQFGENCLRNGDEIFMNEKADGGGYVNKYFDAEGNELRSEESTGIESSSEDTNTDDYYRKECADYLYPFDMAQYVLAAEKDKRYRVFVMLRDIKRDLLRAITSNGVADEASGQTARAESDESRASSGIKAANQYSSWAVYGLQGAVKSVKYSDGWSYDFNDKGEVTLFKGSPDDPGITYTYKSATQYTVTDGYGSVDMNIVIKGDKRENLGAKGDHTRDCTYLFDKQGRIISINGWLDGPLVEIKYGYAKDSDRLPSTETTVSEDIGVSYTYVRKYEYVETDARGNWTKARVTTKTTETDTEVNRVISSQSETSTSTRTITYY